MEKEFPLKLSIIVPVYNVEKYIARCLHSLLNQDIPQNEYEIIVVDDGTPDDSARIAQSIADKNKNVIVVHRENGGLSAARNTGLQYVHGRYVFFVDSDDFIEPNVLSTILNSAEKRGLDILGFSTCRRRKDNHINWVHTFNDYLDDTGIIDGFTLLRKGFEPTSVWSYLYQVEFLNYHNFRFKEGIIHEDIEFNYRIFLKATRFGVTNLLVYNYCLNEMQSITKGRNLNQEAYALTSNMDVAASIKSYIRKESIPVDIFKKYDSIMNSLLVSQIVSFNKGNGRKQPIEFVRQYISKSKGLGVYPIIGYSYNLRTRVTRLIINIQPLLMFILRITRR